MARTRERAAPQKGSGGAERLFPWLRDWHCLAFLALLLALFFREVIFQQAFFWEDFLYQFYPFRNFASVAFSQGDIPLWNPYTFGGMPFQADITGTVFYLPHFLLVPLVSEGALSFWYVEMFIIAHFLLSGATMFYCARHFGLNRLGATFSALVYMFSGFMVLHVIHLVTICQAAWIPLATLLFSKTLSRRSLGNMVLAGFVLSLVVLGGHIQITLYFFLFLLVFFLVRLWAGISHARLSKSGFPARFVLHTSGLSAGVILIAVSLGAIQILPTIELAGLSIRETITYEKSCEGQLHWQQLVTTVIPKFFGSSNALGNGNPQPYWGPETFWAYWESTLYTGLAALALTLLALPALKTDRNLLFFAGFAIFALMSALGDHFIIHKIFFNFVPGFDRFRSIGRWGFFVMYAVALLSGVGLQNLVTATVNRRLLKGIVLALPAIVLAIVVATHLNLLDSMIMSQSKSGALKSANSNTVFQLARTIVTSEGMTALVVALVCCGAIYLLHRRSISLTTGVALIFLVQFGDMYLYGFAHNNGRTNPDAYFRQQSRLIDLLKDQGRTEYFRVNARNSSGIIIDRNQGMIDGIFMTEGYTQLALQRRFPPAHTADGMLDLLNVKYRAQNETVFVQNRPQVRPRLEPDSVYLPRAFFVYRYKTFETAQQESLFMAGAEFDPRRVAVFTEDPGVSLDDTTPGDDWRSDILSYEINDITLRVFTPRPGILVLSEIFYPGWNAYIDGKYTPVHRVNWSLRGIVVDAGSHDIVLRFEPGSFSAGATVSMISLVLCCLISGAAVWKNRQRHRISV